MIKTKFRLREANLTDIPFLVETIIEAEKSGTGILTYNTVFGLSESETREYLTKILQEQVDGCELSVSSYYLAESGPETAGAISAWIEGSEGIPSNILKGNLLGYYLPQQAMERARDANSLISGLNIEYIPDTIQIGLVYVAESFRGQNLAGILIDEQIKNLLKKKPDLKSAYVQVYGNNNGAIRAYEKTGFITELIKTSPDSRTLIYMPYNSKVLMKKSINH